MPEQFASFNPFVSRQTLPYSSCDGLLTNQRRHGGKCSSSWWHSRRLLKTFPNQSSKAEQQHRKKKSGVSASETQANAVRFLTTNQATKRNHWFLKPHQTKHKTWLRWNHLGLGSPGALKIALGEIPTTATPEQHSQISPMCGDHQAPGVLIATTPDRCL